MGGNQPSPAVIIRHLIDRGPGYMPPSQPLPPPWDGIYRIVKKAGSTFRARRSAFQRITSDLHDYVRIRLMVEDALKPHQFYGVSPSGEIYRLDPLPAPSLDGSPKSLTVMPAAHAFTHTVETRWLVHDLITHPSLTLIAGGSGAKKTLVVLDLAVSLALGVTWLDHPTNQANVLWIDEESGRDRFLKRLARSMRAHTAPAELPFYTASLTGFDLRDPDCLHAVAAHARRHTTSLIVIDPLAGVIPGADENSVLTLVPIFRALRTLSHELDAAVILIHHTNKSGIYRGSTHLRGAVDLLLMVHSRRDTPLIEFQTIKTRDIAHQSFAAQIHFDPPHNAPERVWLIPAGLPETRLAVRTGQSPSPAAQHILDYLHAHGPSPTKKITRSAQNCTPQQARSALYKLISMGLIVRINEGSKGKTATYALNE